MYFDINDDISDAARAEIYIDIWRGRPNPAPRLSINGGETIVPDVGERWSRSPFVAEIPLEGLVEGENILNLWTRSSLYHIHDIAIRVYHTEDQPLLENGAPVVVPEATLLSIADDNSTVTNLEDGGVLFIDGDTLTLTATSTTDANFIEFHAYYDGYDEDNDGLTLDWHNRTRNNWHPGGTSQRLGSGGTIDHIGTVQPNRNGNRQVSIDWEIPYIAAQSGVRFKVRVVDGDGNVRDAAGGPTGEFELRRVTTRVDTFTIPNFLDGVLHHGGIGDFPDFFNRVISLPADLSGYTEAMVIAAYWQNPLLSINENTPFAAFETGEDHWQLSIRDVDISHFQGGNNILTYMYSGRQFGEFIEKPGPMVILRGPATP